MSRTSTEPAGENAFPAPGYELRQVEGRHGWIESHDLHAGPPSPGMSLRDYFAAKALQGFCANPAVFAANGMNGWSLVNSTEAGLIEYCLGLADAMVAARAAVTPAAQPCGGTEGRRETK